MMTRMILWLASGMVIALFGYLGSSSGANESTRIGIPPEIVADYVHAVIEADRTFYTVHVVERLQTKGVVVASQNWLQANTLPLPVQFLMESAKLAALTGTKLDYRLISLWPINEQNKPATEFERKALQDLLRNPDRPHTSFATNGEGKYFEAVYADRAVSQACIGCHNAHPNSPKRDFRMNEVMGGVAITIPVAQ
jgi:uncharacterized protein DUF3365